jgi:hypothetical protein
VTGRWGKRIFAGWWDHEILMIEAANTLPACEYKSALRDIADITARGIRAVEQKGYRMMVDAKTASIKEAARRITVAAPARSLTMADLPPSTIRGPSMAQLMGGRA